MLETNIINTKRLVLREFRDEDAQDVYEYASNENVVKYLGFEPHQSVEASLDVIQKFYKNANVFAIEYNGKCIGCIEIRVDLLNEVADIGYILNYNYWNQGFLTEALKEIIKYCFDTLKLNRVQASHFVENKASGRVMQKAGMLYEGTCIQKIKRKDIFYDVVMYGIVKEKR